MRVRVCACASLSAQVLRGETTMPRTENLGQTNTQDGKEEGRGGKKMMKRIGETERGEKEERSV